MSADAPLADAQSTPAVSATDTIATIARCIATTVSQCAMLAVQATVVVDMARTDTMVAAMAIIITGATIVSQAIVDVATTVIVVRDDAVNF